MTDERKIELLAEILDAEANDLTPETVLTEAGDWDSLAILSFISMMDDEFGKEIGGATVRKLSTVGDVLALMEG